MSDDWKKKLAKELHRPKLHRFPRRKIYSPNLDRIWTMDLMDQKKYYRQNKNFKYILVVLDIFSRFAWARPLKTKTGLEVANAMRDIFAKSKRKPSYIWSDQGKEFLNHLMIRGLLREKDITLYYSFNDPKASIAERFIRTLRRKFELHYVVTQQTVWYNVLQDFIDEYNSEKHKSIKMSPNQALKPENYAAVFSSQYSRVRTSREDLLKVGTKVRITLHKRQFEKGSTANWSEEVYEIDRVTRRKPVDVYRLKDLAGEVLDGGFYREQMQVTDQEIYRIDKVLRKRKMRDGTSQSFVRWSGFPDKFNSWIDSGDVLLSRNR